MPPPTVTLEEQRADIRSRQVAFRLTVQVAAPERLRIQAVEPRIPREGRLVEIVDTSLAEIDSRRKELMDSLNVMLRSAQLVDSKAFREALVTKQRETFKEALSFNRFFQLYAEIVFPVFFSKRSFRSWAKREFNSIRYTIYSAADGRTAYSKWIVDRDDLKAIDGIFDEKLKQLEQIEGKLGKTDDVGIAEVDASAPFSSTYVVDFSRGLFESRKYQVSFELDYLQLDSSSVTPMRPKSTTYSCVTEITPNPVTLSIVAALSAVLGGAIKILLSSNETINHVAAHLNSTQLVVAPMVAVVFFNAYEQTTLGRGIKISLNWRAALLIGALCGLAQERIVAALKALIGA